MPSRSHGVAVQLLSALFTQFYTQLIELGDGLLQILRNDGASGTLVTGLIFGPFVASQGVGIFLEGNAGPLRVGDAVNPNVQRAIRVSSLLLSGAAPATSTVCIGGTTAATVGAAGGAAAPPATPVGYLNANIANTAVKIPYYNA